MGRGVFRNYYKGYVDKTKGEGEAREGGEFGWGGGEWWRENVGNCN